MRVVWRVFEQAELDESGKRSDKHIRSGDELVVAALHFECDISQISFRSQPNKTLLNRLDRVNLVSNGRLCFGKVVRVLGLDDKMERAKRQRG